MELNKDMLEQIVRTGRQAALAAGALLRQNFYKPHRIIFKGAIDPVTESDLQSQELIVALIRRSFPDHGFLAEETAGEGGYEGLRPSAIPSPASEPRPCRWIIDPLDGTVNFAHGLPAFCVSIALKVEGRLEYGVVYDPLRDELFEGRRGQGALLNGRAIQVSGIDRLDRALVATGFPYDIRERLPETLARMRRILGVVQGLRRVGSAALDMAYLACGRFEAFYEENLKPWDTAAGLLLISEAGGRLTNFSGGPYDLYSPNILASNGILHTQLLSCLKEDYRQVECLNEVDEPVFVGADGCKGGWFAIQLTKGGKWHTKLSPSISKLWEEYHNASLILLDVPIGIKEAGSHERLCDIEARRKLGPNRGRCVFRVPVRPAIYADTYEEAKDINIKLSGKSVPVFTWGIVPKIKEVDTFLLSHENAGERIKEIHPELCFWALSEGNAMEHSKKTAEGFDERLNFLCNRFPQAKEIISHALNNYRRRDVSKDDILDALAAAVTAFLGFGNFPNPTEFDEKGLPMQMLHLPRQGRSQTDSI